jgi:hypothetical protein
MGFQYTAVESQIDLNFPIIAVAVPYLGANAILKRHHPFTSVLRLCQRKDAWYLGMVRNHRDNRSDCPTSAKLCAALGLAQTSYSHIQCKGIFPI